MHTSEEPQNHRRRLLVHITCTAPPASYRSRPCHAFSMTKERGAFHKASFVSVSINTKIGPRMLYWRPASIGQCLWGQPAHMNSLKGSKMAWLAVVDDGTQTRCGDASSLRRSTSTHNAACRDIACRYFVPQDSDARAITSPKDTLFVFPALC
jgi:hypothetical protein